MSNFHCLSELYLRCFCNLIFPLQAYVFIACTYLYCKLIFVMQAHVFIASPYFHCKRIFSLFPHIFVATSWKYFPRFAKNFSRCSQNFSRSGGMQNPENRTTVIVKTRLRLMATCESHKVLERTRKALNFLQLQQFSTGKEPRNLLFEGSRNGGFEYRSCFSYLNKRNRRI